MHSIIWFDAKNVDPATVELASAGVAVSAKGNKYMAHREDVNKDGFVDLVLHVIALELDPYALQIQDGYATLTGITYDGKAIDGIDEIVIVHPK